MSVPATTIGDLLTDALVDSGAFGVGMPPPASAVIKGLQQLNWLISQWNRKRYLIYQLIDLSLTANGSQSYSFGPTGQLVIDKRPDKLNAAYMRQLNASPNTPVDYPLRVLDTYEDYSRVSLKLLETWTQWVFYDPGFPNGLLYPWPVMQAGFELHVIVKRVLERYDALSAPVGLPEEYEGAFYAILKVKFRANYRLRPDTVDIGMAKEALGVIRGANSAISSMKFPRALRANRNKYNIYSDDN